jgi:hypothetical protein
MNQLKKTWKLKVTYTNYMTMNGKFLTLEVEQPSRSPEMCKHLWFNHLQCESHNSIIPATYHCQTHTLHRREVCRRNTCSAGRWGRVNIQRFMLPQLNTRLHVIQTNQTTPQKAGVLSARLPFKQTVSWMRPTTHTAFLFAVALLHPTGFVRDTLNKRAPVAHVPRSQITQHTFRHGFQQ